MAEGGKGWLHAVGLMAATMLLSVLSPTVLFAVPFGLLVVFLPDRRILGVLLAAGCLALVGMGDPTSGLWYVERGWALLLGGCFLALSLRWPEGRFLPRGLGAVLGASLLMAMILLVRPGEWEILDWAVRSRMEEAVGAFLQAARARLGPEMVSGAVEVRALETVALQSLIFPSLQALASLSALALSWWLFKRLGGHPRGGLETFREFRFNDQLVWILILGMAALLVSSGVFARLGANAVVFIGALYALRGAAVVLFLTGGFSIFGGILLFVGFLLVAPFVVMGAVFIGLGDTWFDLRKRRIPRRPEI